jgi:LysM repeat protein/N-acetyl-anhydromuramyl-L-alanine amidase AmpD
MSFPISSNQTSDGAALSLDNLTATEAVDGHAPSAASAHNRSRDTYSSRGGSTSLFSSLSLVAASTAARNSDPPVHVVARKETLYSIAKQHGVTVDQLQALNPGLTSAIVPGQRIKLPASRSAASHRVVEGDTVYNLAQRYNVTMQQLRDANGIGSDNNLRLGQVLRLPTGSTSQKTTPSKATGVEAKPTESTTTATADSKVEGGKLIHANVTQKIFSGLEHGTLEKVDAIVLHQTASSSATKTLNAYKNQSTGAHFLIARDGTLYQTARLNKRAYHVGNIRSRCLVEGECDETSAEYKILHGKGSYSSRVEDLSDHEKEKSYPDRYPVNSDALGIEIVGEYNSATEEWDAVNAKQNETLEWLMAELQSHYSLDDEDVYFHNEVAYKKEGEAETAKW